MVRAPIAIVSRPPRREAERLAGFDRAGFPAFLIRSDIFFSEILCCPQSAESKYRIDRADFLVFFARTDILLIAGSEVTWLETQQTGCRGPRAQEAPKRLRNRQLRAGDRAHTLVPQPGTLSLVIAA
jgi:hypothetical protein